MRLGHLVGAGRKVVVVVGQSIHGVDHYRGLLRVDPTLVERATGRLERLVQSVGQADLPMGPSPGHTGLVRQPRRSRRSPESAPICCGPHRPTPSTAVRPTCSRPGTTRGAPRTAPARSSTTPGLPPPGPTPCPALGRTGPPHTRRVLVARAVPARRRLAVLLPAPCSPSRAHAALSWSWTQRYADSIICSDPWVTAVDGHAPVLTVDAEWPVAWPNWSLGESGCRSAVNSHALRL